MQWTPDKVTALLLIICSTILLFCGINGEVKSILTMAAGYLFGSAYTERKLVH